MAIPRSPFLSSAARYAAAVLAVGVALVLRQSLVAHFGELPHYVTFYPAVMLTALFCGVGPGLLATGVGAVAAAYWILPPYDSFLPIRLSVGSRTISEIRTHGGTP